MMAKEIDHRVMNSLQLVSSVLRLQSRSTLAARGQQRARLCRRPGVRHRPDPPAYYLSEGVEQVDCKPYLERLCADLSQMLPPGRGEAIRVEGVEARISTAQIVALGLIVNELVTNAIKYGSGRITVSVQRLPGRRPLGGRPGARPSCRLRPGQGRARHEGGLGPRAADGAWTFDVLARRPTTELKSPSCLQVWT